MLPEYRRNVHALGKALSYVRFLFMRMHRPWFRNQVLSELLPPLEPNEEVNGLPAYRAAGDEPFMFDGRLVLRLRSRSGRRWR